MVQLPSSKRGLTHPLKQFCKNLAYFLGRPRPGLAALATLLLFLLVLATTFAAWHKPSAFWASLPGAADPGAILPCLFPGRNSRRLVPSLPKNLADLAAEDPVGLLDEDDDGRREQASCDLFEGEWVVAGAGEEEEAPGPAYRPGSCPFVDEAFDCAGNGRPDSGYATLRWKPRGCNLPRLDGKGMLEMLRGKRLVFVGDSLNRNMWQSLVCILRESVPEKNRVFEISGRREFRTEGFYAIKYEDFNCTIEFVRAPFLVQEWETSDADGSRRQTLRLDMMDDFSAKYQDADIVVFNTAHWWTHPRTSQGKDFYQEGEHVYSQLSAEDAYRKALGTWAKWLDANINPDRTLVFFRGYSSSHYRGGQWNSGGNCHGETLPIADAAHLGKYPKMMSIFESVVAEMATPVHYLNITKMTSYRKDGHPSRWLRPGKAAQPDATQDCSHWCLPGVPDAWNELLYAMLLVRDDPSWSSNKSLGGQHVAART